MSRHQRSPSVSAPLDLRLADPAAERVRRSHAQTLEEMRGAFPIVIRSVQLPNNVDTPVAHGLGRAPLWVSPGAPRGATTTGRIDDMGTRTSAGVPIDRSKSVVLRATGFGATITVDVAVL